MADPTDIDIASLLSGDEPSAQAKAQAMVRALRGQQAAAQQRQFLAGLAGNFNNRGADAMGKMFGEMGANEYEQAGKQLAAIPDATKFRLTKALEALRLAQQVAHETGQLEETKRSNIADERLKREQLERSKWGVVAPGGQLYNTTTGELGGMGPPKPEGGGTKGGKELDTMLRGLREDIDHSSGRGAGLFGKDQGLVTAADKVLALIHGPDGKTNYNLTVRQMPELVQSVAAMLSAGNVPAQAQLEHLMPNTAGMNLAQKLEYLTGHPQEANAPEFVKQYAETAEREKNLAKQRIRDVQLRRLPLHAGGFASHPSEYTAAARQYLSDLSDEDLASAFAGKYEAKVPAGAGNLSPEKQRRLEELRRKAAERASK